jgi:hypothetical protein
MKTEVYSWRLSPHLKSELQEAARVERKSLSDLLEKIAKDWLQRTRHQSEDEEERQRRLHEAAMECAGTIDGAGRIAPRASGPKCARGSHAGTDGRSWGLIDTGAILASLLMATGGTCLP